MGTVAASLCDANLATCGLLHPLDCRLRNCWSLILSASEAKYRPEDDSQESETNSKPGTFTEALGHIDAQNNQNDEVNKGNQHQEDPPPGSSDNLAPDVEVIDWDDAGPARLAAFVNTFHIATIRNSAMSSPTIVETGLGALPSVLYSTCASRETLWKKRFCGSWMIDVI